MADIPFAPVILASVTNETPDGSTVLKLETKLTRRQLDDIDTIHQVVDLMRETMEEILHVRG